MQRFDCPNCTASGHTTHAGTLPRHACADGKDAPLRLVEGALDATPEAVDEPEPDA